MNSSAQNKSENANKTGARQLGNQVIRKGHMVIQNLGIMKGNQVFKYIYIYTQIYISISIYTLVQYLTLVNLVKH